METERRDPDSVREFRLEGAGLLVLGGLLLTALVGSFMLGRWYERTTSPVAQQFDSIDSDPLAHVVDDQQAADVNEDASFFDTVEGGEKQSEPERQARRNSSPPRRSTAAEAEPAPSGPTETAAPTPAPESGAGGPYYVQVFAGRDRRAAEGLVQRLQAEGQPVKLFSEREGSGSLFKVRVGGFSSEDAARQAASELSGGGYAGAWVTRVDE